jgi:hypothetical protein
MAERLSPEDSRILALESRSIVGHTCKVVIVEPRGGDGVTYLRDRIARRIALAPSCRRRIVMTPPQSRRAGVGRRPNFDVAGTSVGARRRPSEMRSCARSSPG